MSVSTLSFDVQHPKGFTVTLSLETESLKDAVEKFEDLVPILESKGWTPVDDNQLQKSNDAQSESAPTLPNGTPDPGWCPIHNCAMKRREKDGQVWYSHKIKNTEEWCKGQV